MVRVEERGSLEECVEKMFNNHAVITCDKFSKGEFAVVINNIAYYEDGAYLGTGEEETMEFFNSEDNQEWAKGAQWSIIGYLEDKDMEKIKKETKRYLFAYQIAKLINSIVNE